MPTTRGQLIGGKTLAQLASEGMIAPEQAGLKLVPAARTRTGKPREPQPRQLKLSFVIDVQTTNESNRGGSLRGRLARKAAEKKATELVLPPWGVVRLPCVVTLTRLGVREMDGDGLRTSLKYVRDTLAKWLGVDDADPRVKWVYRQRAAWRAGVLVEVRETQ
jgi:hypothetical protein